MNSNKSCWSAAARALTFASVILTSGLLHAHPRTVRLPAGSIDGLAAAIASAGPGGTVILKSGLHTESGTVSVGFRVNIIGEPGAILETSTSPDPDYPITIEAALHLKNAPHAKVEGIWFRPPASAVGSCAVVIEDSTNARVLHNRMSDYQFGVLVHHGDHAWINGNTIQVSDAWALDPGDPGFLVEADGIIVINGRYVRVTDNAISGGFQGIWLCDEKGYCAENTLTDNYIGLILCRVATENFVISGADAAASQPGTEWLVYRNAAHDNDWGIQVTDGTHHNVLLNNQATGNHVYDCELTGDTERWGLPDPVPGCFENLVVQGGRTSLRVKDCGANNTLRGNVSLVDTNADPCY